MPVMADKEGAPAMTPEEAADYIVTACLSDKEPPENLWTLAEKTIQSQRAAAVAEAREEIEKRAFMAGWESRDRHYTIPDEEDPEIDYEQWKEEQAR